MISRKLAKPLLFAYESRSNLLLRYLTSRYPLNARNEKRVLSKSNLDGNLVGNLEDDIDKPIPYSQTKAATYKAGDFHETLKDVPDCHNLVVAGSLATFMLYFFILREPNDIDELLSRDLTDVLPDVRYSE